MIALYFILFWIIVAIVLVTRHYYSEDMKMTPAATGSVLFAESREVRDSRGRRDETIVTCQFTVNGRAFQVTKIFRGRNAENSPPQAENSPSVTTPAAPPWPESQADPLQLDRPAP